MVGRTEAIALMSGFGDTGQYDQESGAWGGGHNRVNGPLPWPASGLPKPGPGWACSLHRHSCPGIWGPFLSSPGISKACLCLLCLLSSHCPLEEG